MNLPRLSLKIPLGLTIAVVLTGIVAFTKISAKTGAIRNDPSFSGLFVGNSNRDHHLLALGFRG